MSFWDFLQSTRIDRIEHNQMVLSNRVARMEYDMAKDRDALAQLDAELEALEAYVKSDEDNDAAEIEARTNRIRTMLAGAQGSGEVDGDKVDEVENKLNELNDQA